MPPPNARNQNAKPARKSRFPGIGGIMVGADPKTKDLLKPRKQPTLSVAKRLLGPFMPATAEIPLKVNP